MEMASSSISDLWPTVRRRDLLPDVNGGVERLNLSRYGTSYLASLDQFWFSSHGCRDEVCPRNICLGCYVLGNSVSYPRLSATSTKRFGCFSLKYWWWYSCRYLLITLTAVCVHLALPLRLKIKVMGEPSLVFTGICVDIYVTFQLPSEKYKIVSWKKKEFEDIEDLLFSFWLYFVIVEVSSCIYTMYYLLLQIYMVLIVKKNLKLYVDASGHLD